MAKLTTPQIKEMIADRMARTHLDYAMRIPANERILSLTSEGWTRQSKKRDGEVFVRIFECWVGWNQLRATVKTNHPADDQVVSLDIRLVDWDNER